MIWCYATFPWFISWVLSQVWNPGRRIWIQFAGSSKRTGEENLVASLEYASWILEKKRGSSFIDSWWKNFHVRCFYIRPSLGKGLWIGCWSRLGVRWFHYVYTARGTTWHQLHHLDPFGATCFHLSAIDMYNHGGYTRTICAYWIILVLLYVTKIHDAFQVSVHDWIFKVFHNLTWPSQNIHVGWVGDPLENEIHSA